METSAECPVVRGQPEGDSDKPDDGLPEDLDE